MRSSSGAMRARSAGPRLSDASASPRAAGPPRRRVDRLAPAAGWVALELLQRGVVGPTSSHLASQKKKSGISPTRLLSRGPVSKRHCRDSTPLTPVPPVPVRQVRPQGGTSADEIVVCPTCPAYPTCFLKSRPGPLHARAKQVRQVGQVGHVPVVAVFVPLR